MQTVGSRRIAGLFTGIGGFEIGLGRAGHTTAMLCEIWSPAVDVLRSNSHFADVPIHGDIRALRLGDISQDVDLVTAGFPCTDLSQVGRKAGIMGEQSRLVFSIFDLLANFERKGRPLPDLLFENVPNMLSLNKGRAMAALVSRLDGLGYRWAYRTVDSRFTGVPQRRRRVFLFASIETDPAEVLFADDAGEPEDDRYASDAFGFYWTEGRRGLGWAQDAVPTLKGGSGVGIPSAPAVWVPDAEAGQRLVVPTIEDAEALQGFARGHTATAQTKSSNGPRWKLVGNAVTVGVAQWLGERIAQPGIPVGGETRWNRRGRWPNAARSDGSSVQAVQVSEFPRVEPYIHLSDLLSLESAQPLSLRATSGFWSRLQETNLGRHPGFRAALVEHIDHCEALEEASAA